MNVLILTERNSGTNMYIYYPQSVTWSEAQSYCRLHHTDLASTRNSSEFSAVLGSVTSSIWFGLFRTWRWLDQIPSSIVSWMPGQPDRLYGNEDCASINNGQLSDELCANVKPFFCEVGKNHKHPVATYGLLSTALSYM